jgi:SHS family lactate transporter-like MFS transporter
MKALHAAGEPARFVQSARSFGADPLSDSTSDARARPGSASRDAAFAVLAGFLGWTLDAFDFFLVVIALPTIALEFHKTKTEVALSVTLTLMFRPVGALVFGLLADRFGRRWPMIIDLIFYSGVEVATGFAHSFTVFLILRALFGIGMGGEWGVGASLVMEKVPARWRGVLSGVLQEGYAVGYLLAAVAAHFMLTKYGWRSMFFLGGAPAVLALFVRFGVGESEVWKKNKSESWSQLGSAIVSNWKLWIYLTVLMALMNLSSHGTQDMYPSFLKTDHGIEAQRYTNVVVISMIGAISGGVLFGLASDRFGRRRAIITAFAGALCVIPIWAFSSTLVTLTLGAFLMQFMIQGAWGVIPAHINELAPDSVRGFLPGFAYQCGNLIAASIGAAQARIAEHSSYAHALASTAVAIFLIAIVVNLLGWERRGIVFGAPEANDAGRGFEVIPRPKMIGDP